MWEENCDVNAQQQSTRGIEPDVRILPCRLPCRHRSNVKYLSCHLLIVCFSFLPHTIWISSFYQQVIFFSLSFAPPTLVKTKTLRFGWRVDLRVLGRLGVIISLMKMLSLLLRVFFNKGNCIKSSLTRPNLHVSGFCLRAIKTEWSLRTSNSHKCAPLLKTKVWLFSSSTA